MTNTSRTGRIRRPVFLDEAGARWRLVRRVGIALGVITTVLAIALAIAVMVPPSVPDLALSDSGAARSPKLVTSRRERLRLGKRLQLWFALEANHPPPALHPSQLQLHPRFIPARQRPAGQPIVAGFYVNWDDNSLEALRQHYDDLDWVVCEWGFLQPGGDSLKMRIDRRVPYTLSHVAEEKQRPQLFLMLSSFDSVTKKWDAKSLRHLLTDSAASDRAIKQLSDTVVKYGMAGVTIDFEEVPRDIMDREVQFTRALHKEMASKGRLVTQAVSFNDTDRDLARFAAVNDKLFLMLYDEHFGGRGDPGPVASQQWYVQTAQHMLRFIPRDKAILTVGAYGYDWNDADPTGGATITFQEVMSRVRETTEEGRPARVAFDSVTLNPYATWTDADSTDHLAWYLDAVTAYNQFEATRELGAAGHAIWRLGSEDPAIWSVIGRSGIDAPALKLDSIPPGYLVDFIPRTDGGEILKVLSRPTSGRRTIQFDSTTHLVVNEHLVAPATPYVVRRFGRSPHKVALTFDDGPDGRWTASILDTLKSRHAPATFFLIGQNVEAHIPLVRRLFNEGHEIGNHTFTHPNLYLTATSKYGTKLVELQLDATERLLEAVLDRRSAFFRPPYFGDAEPTTADELVPVSIANDRGYLTIGLHIDSEDWQSPGIQTIIDTTLDQRERTHGNVVLLHDGGGDRSQTVAALGPLIDSLRARGDTLVTVSELVGIPRDQAMLPLPPRGKFVRYSELVGFATIGVLEWACYWVFLIAIGLGFARLVVMTTLAIAHRLKRHQNPDAPVTYSPPVSVIVPAYNEAKVINATIASLVAQEYPGPLEVVVVDDGSADDTYDVASAAYGHHPAVRVYRKPNGGKASALNYGLTVAKGEIVICLDADTLFTPLTVRELVEPLSDPNVGAVAGNAKVGNRINLITRWQAIEYVTSQNLDRRAFSLLNCITVVPGAVGAWRKSLVQEVGGFSENTLAEDQDLTLSIRRRGHSIAYADEAIGYTEAPDTISALAKQRFRWAFGTLQCLYKHRRVLFNPKFGSLGLVALPNNLIFQIFYPAISPLADFMFLWSLLTVWLARAQHGATWSLTSLQQVLTYYAIFLLLDWLATMVAFLLEPDEDKSLTWLVFLQRFAYRQIMYWVVVRSLFAALKGRGVGWGKLERKATVETALKQTLAMGP